MFDPLTSYEFVPNRYYGTIVVWQKSLACLGEIREVRIDGRPRYLIVGEPTIYLTADAAAEELRDRQGNRGPAQETR